jgi:hypothetical protein
MTVYGSACAPATSSSDRERGATTLIWQTARDNLRARPSTSAWGAVREEWLDYSLAV